MEGIYEARHEASQPPKQQYNNERKARCCIIGEFVRLMMVRGERHDNDENYPGCNANSLLQLG
jgi:hypothetical protein